MLKYIGRRLALGIVTAWIVVTVTFFLIHLIPGDPLSAGGKQLPDQAKENFRKKYGLDQPVLVQYGMYLKNLLKADLGDSLIYVGRSVNDFIREGAPVSGKIGLMAFVIEIIIGLLLGIIAAFNRGKPTDQVILVLIVIGICIPSFVMASMLQYIFGVKLKLLPIFGFGEFKHMILPSIAIAVYGIATYGKYMRNSVLNVIGEDYILTARAKGVSTSSLVLKHVMRNALIPIITFAAVNIMFIFTGSFVIEKIFNIPGLGAYYVIAVSDSDYTLILGLTIFVAVLYILSLIIVDILYGVVDPRIRLGRGKK